ncbi:GspH/FimT family pseudopilin [Halomonas tibetensis]|uniref:Type II secretion system protein H n=1 Tax=Halomonas tibetensis TaxID=2259590 RepID=A0ABV7B7V2_9GAMM
MHPATPFSSHIDGGYYTATPRTRVKPCPPQRQQGLTLIELIVVIAVLAIITTVGIPNFQQFTARNEVAAEVMKLKSALSMAQTHAIMKRSTVTLCPSADRTSCSNGDWSLPLLVIHGRAESGDINGEILRHFNPGRVESVTYRNDNRPIRYGRLGRPAGHNGTLRICGRMGTGASVIVSNFGRVRVVSGRPSEC